jgi:6-pyruvoyltetrahydropterin/6-carboxytetrahydropterin synthase
MTDRTSAPIALLQRWETFCAAHRLYDERMTPEQNDALYGPCAREFGHGHNYRIGVTLKGGVDARTGMIVNITEIKQAVQELILDDMDHRHLNHDSRLMRGINPTAENLAVVCWTVLHERFGALLHEVQIEETANNLVIYRGERG